MAEKAREAVRYRRNGITGDDDLIRAKIDSLIRQSAHDTYASISDLLGRNHAYIQQYIKRSTPRTLREADRRMIAQHFGVSPGTLYAGAAPNDDFGNPVRPLAANGEDAAPDIVVVPVNRMSKGTEQDAIGHARELAVGLSRDLICTLTENIEFNELLLVEVHDDAMAPTLSEGDLILIAAGTCPPIRDGVYALRVNGMILPRRISLCPDGKRIGVNSDNALYDGWHDCEPGGLEIMGPVIWCGRKL